MKRNFLLLFTILVCLVSNLFYATAAENATAVFTPTSSLTGFQYIAGNGPSNEQSFKVSGINLTGNLIVTAPTNYEISPLSGSSFFSMSNITIAHSGGVVSELTLYVRLKAGLAANVYSGNLSIASSGAQTQYIALSGNVLNPPTLSTSVTSISGLFSFFDISQSYYVGQSTVKSFSVSGTDLKSILVITPPSNFEISTNSTIGFSNSSISLLPPGSGTLNTTIYVRLNPNIYPTYDYYGNLTVSSTGATSKTVSLSGRSSYMPVITISTTALTAFNYFVGSGPSAQQSFTVSATNLTDPVVITAPTNYEISIYSGSSFVGQASITLNASNYTLYNTTLYVRLKAGLLPSSYAGNLTCTSVNATAKNISLLGSVTSQPVVNVSTTILTGFKYNIGAGPSTDRVFTVSGSSLSSIIFIYAPTNYEISTSGGTAFSGSGSIILPQTGGNVPETNIYVRLKAGLAEGNYNENLTITSTNIANKTVALSGIVVNPNGLTVSETAFPGMDYVTGNGPSSEKIFYVSGASISSIVIITAPDNYEMSTSSGTRFEGSQQLILQPVSGVIYTKTIFVRLKSGLTAGTYAGNISVTTAGYPTKTISLSGTVTNPVVLLKDPAYYEPRNNGAIKLTNNWLFANSLGNYNYTADLLGTSATVRAMAVRNGKMLFCSRGVTNQIISVDGKTGTRSYVNLASNVFKYAVRNYNNTADSLVSVSYPCNDIKVDKGGSVLVSNLIMSSTSRFQIWKINPEIGSGTVLIDQSDFSLLYPGRAIRFESFNVLGDVNSSATIFAVCSSVTNVKEMYKWKITNGIASSTPELVKLDAAPDAVFGNAVTVFPVDEENFYIDGDKIMPFKYNVSNGFGDSFKYYPYLYTDSITSPLYRSKITQTVNGIIELTVGSEKFLVVTTTNNSTLSYSPPSTFRIYKYPWYNEKFAALECLWTFPLNGLGTAVMSNRIASAAVEVSAKKATIYIYYPENGYGVYELNVDTGTFTNSAKDNQEQIIRVVGDEIRASEMLSQMDIYTVTGQLLKSARNTISVIKPQFPGVYIVKFQNTSGLKLSQKIVIE